MMNRLTAKQCLPAILCAMVAVSIGWYAHKWYHHHVEYHAERRVTSKGYTYTSPLLDVELPEGVTITSEPHPFKYLIESYIKDATARGSVKDIAVYYRDLHDGPWFAINNAIEFNPASMMKVPVMIAWLKRAERNPGVLQRRLTFDRLRDSVPEEYTRPARQITLGQSYSIDELLHFMMNYSDNKATSLLYNALTERELSEVLDSMDVNNNPNKDGNSLTIHGYSGFFRILYNAAYLNREMSEKALQLLSLQDFPTGIVGGVPRNVKVSAKFGEIVPPNAAEDIQLHEFGIVYHPRNPYILGIMTRGKDFGAQTGVIREISSLIYTHVDAGNRN